jgi:hypothetical protein
VINVHVILFCTFSKALTILAHLVCNSEPAKQLTTHWTSNADEAWVHMCFSWGIYTFETKSCGLVWIAKPQNRLASHVGNGETKEHQTCQMNFRDPMTHSQMLSPGSKQSFTTCLTIYFVLLLLSKCVQTDLAQNTKIRLLSDFW